MRSKGLSTTTLGLVVVVVLGVVPLGASATTAYYISPAGQDVPTGGTFQLPWRTFKYALPRLRPGDTLLARGGTYAERATGMTLAQGAPSSRVTVRDYPGERPFIRGLLWLNRPSYWTFEGINVTWDATVNQRHEHMVKITDGVGWVWEEAELYRAQSYAALLIYSSRDHAGEPGGWTVRYNCIHDTIGVDPVDAPNQDHLVYVNSGPDGTGGRVTRNILFNSLNGHAVKLGAVTSGQAGPANVTVSYNTMHRNVHQVFAAWSAKYNVMDRNLALTARQKDAQGNVVKKANFRGFALTNDTNVLRNSAGYDSSALEEGGLQNGGGGPTSPPNRPRSSSRSGPRTRPGPGFAPGITPKRAVPSKPTDAMPRETKANAPVPWTSRGPAYPSQAA